MAGFHYEIYRPAATQPGWSTSLSCGLAKTMQRSIYPLGRRWTFSTHKFTQPSQPIISWVDDRLAGLCKLVP